MDIFISTRYRKKRHLNNLDRLDLIKYGPANRASQLRECAYPMCKKKFFPKKGNHRYHAPWCRFMDIRIKNSYVVDKTRWLRRLHKRLELMSMGDYNFPFRLK
jgi:hypothetical protein